LGHFLGTNSDLPLGVSKDRQIAWGRAVFDSQTKFQVENVMAVYLGIAIAGANTLIVMAVAIAFVII
jgi:hypothetical protein